MITTHEELDALPEGTVILNWVGWLLVRLDNGWAYFDGGRPLKASEMVPAVVIEQPAPEPEPVKVASNARGRHLTHWQIKSSMQAQEIQALQEENMRLREKLERQEAEIVRNQHVVLEPPGRISAEIIDAEKDIQDMDEEASAILKLRGLGLDAEDAISAALQVYAAGVTPYQLRHFAGNHAVGKAFPLDMRDDQIASQEMKIDRLAEHLKKSREKVRSQREELARLNAKVDWQDKEITRLIIDRDQARSDNAFNAYQEKTAQTAIYPEDLTLEYLIPGLAAEAGEVAGKWAKIIRDQGGAYDQADADAIIKEVGDVLWFVSEIARYYGVSLDVVAERNLQKLADRKNRGVLGGSGDHR